MDDRRRRATPFRAGAVNGHPPSRRSRRRLKPPILDLLCGAMLALAALVVVTMPLDAAAQTIYAATLGAVALLLYRHAHPAARICMVLISGLMTLRYLYWRFTQSTAPEFGVDMIAMGALLAAEAYTILSLLLNYASVIQPLRRQPMPLPAQRDAWPNVDVFVPTYDEPPEVVRTTLLCMKHLEWPREKLRIWLLDDGRRDEFRAMCKELDVGYIARADNRHAKAGNINHALRHTHGELVAVFDCDFRPASDFLLHTVGWLVHDPKLFLVQAPQSFFVPDPYDRNLGMHGKVPHENEVFYGAIQDGKDCWNATFFCGSAAVLRRAALEEIGGLATDTITEDAHTSLKLHMRGWRSAYVNRRLAAGYSPETVTALITQRVRWAQGTMQMLRREGLWNTRLSIMQNLSYLGGYLYYLNALPRIVLLLAPVGYLLFDIETFDAPTSMVAAYLIPCLLLTQLTAAKLYGRYRHVLWGDVYDTLLAGHLVRPTWTTLLCAKPLRFRVTPKGERLERGYFSHRGGWPCVFLLALAWLGLIAGLVRLTAPGDTGALIVNLAWNCYNLVILTVCVATAWERPQRRREPRVAPPDLSAVMATAEETLRAKVRDGSMTGLRLALEPTARGARAGDALMLRFPAAHPRAVGDVAPSACALPATVVQVRDDVVQVRFAPLTAQQEAWLSWNLYGRPGTWAGATCPPNRYAESAVRLLRTAAAFYAHLARLAWARAARGRIALEAQADAGRVE